MIRVQVRPTNREFNQYAINMEALINHALRNMKSDGRSPIEDKERRFQAETMVRQVDAAMATCQIIST